MNSLTLVSAYSDRGFTDHEHLEDFGLIHMNGRIYDPLLGRFLSADPNIQSPKNTQSLNRFSYVMNNPLSATDPTGYISLSKWLPTLFQIAMAVASGGATWYIQAAFMGATAYAMTGDPKAGLIAAATAGMFSAVGWAGAQGSVQNALGGGYHMTKILAHGIVGGLSAKWGGGNFSDGFRSAAVTQAFAPAIGGIGGDSNTEAYYNIGARAQRIAVAAIVGGTASAAGGGKFANGAVTGAFSRAFNDEADWNRKAIHRTREVKMPVGNSYPGVYAEGEWNDVIGADDLPDTGEIKALKVAAKMLKVLRPNIQQQDVTVGDYQRYDVYSQEELYDLVGGQPENVQSVGRPTLVSRTTEKTNANVHVETRYRLCLLEEAYCP